MAKIVVFQIMKTQQTSAGFADVDVRIAQTEVPKSIGIAAPTTEGGGGPFFGESVRDRCGKHVFVMYAKYGCITFV